MASIVFKEVIKKYGKLEVVHGINLVIEHNEFVVLVGPSGCGKSTTLRMIAGLEEISGGEIFIEDVLVNHLAPRQRNISMVFQNYALYPHMTVRDNLGFALKIANISKQNIIQQVNEAAEILGITELMDRTPAELSGGQRQRVAMGRAIVRHPKVFLFDEPLSNLDAKLRVQMRTEIKKLHQKVKTTIVYVTHDQVEAMTLADRIVVMKDGYIEQVGTPLDVFNNPVNTFVAGFIGSPPMNLIPAKIDKKSLVFADGTNLPVPNRLVNHIAAGEDVILGIRADDINPVGHGINISSEQQATVNLEVILSEPLGTETIIYTQLAGHEIQGKMLNPRAVATKENFDFCFSMDNAHLFNATTKQVIQAAEPLINSMMGETQQQR